jgi:hypothetical protein
MMRSQRGAHNRPLVATYVHRDERLDQSTFGLRAFTCMNTQTRHPSGDRRQSGALPPLLGTTI